MNSVCSECWMFACADAMAYAHISSTHPNTLLASPSRFIASARWCHSLASGANIAL